MAFKKLPVLGLKGKFTLKVKYFPFEISGKE